MSIAVTAEKEKSPDWIATPMLKRFLIALFFLVFLGIGVAGQLGYFSPKHYYETAPDGTYLQKDWGCVDSVSFPSEGGWVNNATEWSFARCEHDYLGALHGSWKVKEGVWVPVWKQGVFPVDARLYVTLKANIIIDISVHSYYEYGN